MIPNPPSSPLLTQTAKPALAGSAQLLQPLVEQRQAQLQTAAIRTQVESNKTLLNMLIKEARPVDSELRRLLSAQFSSSTAKSNTQNELHILLQSKDLLLLKILVQDKEHWALSQRLAVEGKSTTFILKKNPLLLQTNNTSNQAALNILQQSVRETLPRATDMASALRTLFSATPLNNLLLGAHSQQTVAQASLLRQLAQVMGNLYATIPTPKQLTSANQLK